MTKEKWMIFAIVLMIGAIVIISSALVVLWVRHGSLPSEEAAKEEIVEGDSVVYEPIEEDQWFEIRKRFRERNNVLEILDVHEAIKVQVDQLAEKEVNETALKEKLKSLIESYTEAESREIAKEVLLEFVEGYSQGDMEYLIERTNNTEKNEILYLYEVEYLKKQGFLEE